MEPSVEAKPPGRIYVNPKFLASQIPAHQSTTGFPCVSTQQYVPPGISAPYYHPTAPVNPGYWQQSHHYYQGSGVPQIMPQLMHQPFYNVPPPPPPPPPPSQPYQAPAPPTDYKIHQIPEQSRTEQNNTKVLFEEENIAFQHRQVSFLGGCVPPEIGSVDAPSRQNSFRGHYVQSPRGRHLIQLKHSKKKKRKRKSSNQVMNLSQNPIEKTERAKLPTPSKRTVIFTECPTEKQEVEALKEPSHTQLTVSKYKLIRNPELSNPDGEVQEATKHTGSEIITLSASGVQRKRRKSLCEVNRFKLVRSQSACITNNGNQHSLLMKSIDNKLASSDTKAGSSQALNGQVSRFKFVRKPTEEGEKVTDCKTELPDVLPSVKTEVVKTRKRTSSSGSGKLTKADVDNLAISNAKADSNQALNGQASRFKFVRKSIEEGEKVTDLKTELPDVLPNVKTEVVKTRRRTPSSGSGKLMSKYKIVKVKQLANTVVDNKVSGLPTKVAAHNFLSRQSLVRTPLLSRRLSYTKTVRSPVVLSTKYKLVKAKKPVETNLNVAPAVEQLKVGGKLPNSLDHLPVSASVAKRKEKVSKYKLIRNNASKSKVDQSSAFRASRYKLIRSMPTISAFKRDFFHRTGKNFPRKSVVGTKVVQRGSQNFKVSRTRLRRLSASNGAAQMVKRGGAQVVQKGDSVYAVTALKLKRMSSNEVAHLPMAQRNKAVLIARARNRSLATLSSLRKKSTLPCIFLAKFGKCTRQETGKCPYSHSSRKGETKKVMPTCQFFLEGRCRRGEECPYPHVKHSSKTPICLSFISGKCLLGDKCNRRHENICLEFKSTGTCNQGQSCPLKHIKVVKKSRSTRKINKQPEEKKAAPQVRYFEQTEPKSEPAETAVSHDLASKRARLLKRIQDMKNAIAQVGTSEGVVDSRSVTESTRPPVGSLPDFIAIE